MGWHKAIYLVGVTPYASFTVRACRYSVGLFGATLQQQKTNSFISSLFYKRDVLARNLPIWLVACIIFKTTFFNQVQTRYQLLHCFRNALYGRKYSGSRSFISFFLNIYDINSSISLLFRIITFQYRIEVIQWVAKLLYSLCLY